MFGQAHSKHAQNTNNLRVSSVPDLPVQDLVASFVCKAGRVYIGDERISHRLQNRLQNRQCHPLSATATGIIPASTRDEYWPDPAQGLATRITLPLAAVRMGLRLDKPPGLCVRNVQYQSLSFVQSGQPSRRPTNPGEQEPTRRNSALCFG
jgi:hypothetical protein